MGIRPRTKFVKILKARRCHKCGARLPTNRVRCKRCHALAFRPKK